MLPSNKEGPKRRKSETGDAKPDLVGDLAGEEEPRAVRSKAGVDDPGRPRPIKGKAESRCAMALRKGEGSTRPWSNTGAQKPRCTGLRADGVGPKEVLSKTDEVLSSRLRDMAGRVELGRTELRMGEDESTCARSGAGTAEPE